MVRWGGRTFYDYANANGIANPASLLAAPPQPTPEEAAAMLALATGQQPTTAPPLALGAAAPAIVQVGGDPLSRFLGEVESNRQGAHDPNVAIPEQALRSVATGAGAVFAGADLPRQVKTASDAENFIQDLTRAGDWSVIMTVMQNLNAAGNPAFPWESRPEELRAIIPDQIAGMTGTLEQKTAAYAQYMNSQSPEVKQATINAFQQWFKKTRDKYYTAPNKDNANGDLKEYINFEEWQALNYQNALLLYQRGWQKPPTPITDPTGKQVVPEVNENPQFRGGQAIWEAYVNELDPVQRALVDIDPRHDPLMGLSLLGGGAAIGAKGATKAGLSGTARALEATGAIADTAGNAPFAPLPRAITADRGIMRQAGKTAAGLPVTGPVVRATETGASRAAGGLSRALRPLRGVFEEENKAGAEQSRLADRMASEIFAAQDRGVGGQVPTPPGTTRPPDAVPPGSVPQITTFDQAQADQALAAQRARMARQTPPLTNVPVGRWGQTPDGEVANYRAHHPQAGITVRVVRRDVPQQGRLPLRTLTVERWNYDEGGWVPELSRSVTNAAEEGRVERQVLREADALAEEGEGFLPVGQTGLNSWVSEWTDGELDDMIAMAHNPSVRAAMDTDPDPILRRLVEARTDDTVPENPAMDRVLIMDHDMAQGLTELLNAAGERPMSQAALPAFPGEIAGMIDASTPRLTSRAGDTPLEQAPLRAAPPPGAPGAEPMRAAPTERQAPLATAQDVRDLLQPPPPPTPPLRDVAAPLPGPSTPLEPAAPVLPETPVGEPPAVAAAPQVSPAQVEVSIPAITFADIITPGVARDPELAGVLKGFTAATVRGGGGVHTGTLTVDQARKLADLIKPPPLGPGGRRVGEGGPLWPRMAADSADRGQINRRRQALVQLYDDLTKGAPVTPAPPERPLVAPPPETFTPEVKGPALPPPAAEQREVGVTRSLRDYILRHPDAPQSVKDKLENPLRTRAPRGKGASTKGLPEGASVEPTPVIALSEAEIDAISALKGQGQTKDFRRVVDNLRKAWTTAPTHAGTATAPGGNPPTGILPSEARAPQASEVGATEVVEGAPPTRSADTLEVRPTGQTRSDGKPGYLIVDRETGQPVFGKFMKGGVLKEEAERELGYRREDAARSGGLLSPEEIERRKGAVARASLTAQYPHLAPTQTIKEVAEAEIAKREARQAQEDLPRSFLNNQEPTAEQRFRDASDEYSRLVQEIDAKGGVGANPDLVRQASEARDRMYAVREEMAAEQKLTGTQPFAGRMTDAEAWTVRPADRYVTRNGKRERLYHVVNDNTDEVSGVAMRFGEAKKALAKLKADLSAPVEDAAPAAPTPGEAALPTAASIETTPVQEIRDRMIRQQYPKKPIAYVLPDNRLMLIGDDAPATSAMRVRFSRGKPAVRAFVGDIAEITAIHPDPVLIDPQRGFHATDRKLNPLSPNARFGDFSMGLRGDIMRQRPSFAPANDAALEEVLAPFREQLRRGARWAEGRHKEQAGLVNYIDDTVDQLKADYLNTYDPSGGPTHEITSALNLADGIMAALRIIQEVDPNLPIEMDEFAFAPMVGGRKTKLEADPRGDFDAVLRAVFGSSRQGKLGTKGYELAGEERTAEKTGAGAVMNMLSNRISAVAEDNPDEAAALAGLMDEIDLRRQDYINLIGRNRQTQDYYSGIPITAVPGAQAAGSVLGRAAGAVGGALRTAVRGEAQPTPNTERFRPDTASIIDLLSTDAQAFARTTWNNHPEFAGLDGITVFNEITNQVRDDLANYRALLAREGPLPKGKIICPRGQVCRLERGTLTDGQREMARIQHKYQFSLPVAVSLENIDERVLSRNKFQQEVLLENGMIQPGESPSHWLAKFGRWMGGLYHDIGSASGQLALYSPGNFRFMLMNAFSNPAVAVFRYPRLAARGLIGTPFATAYARGVKDTFSPVGKVLEALGVDPEIQTAAETFAARMGFTLPREVGIDERFAHERSARGVRDLLTRLGGKAVKIGDKDLTDIAAPLERGYRRATTIESEQRYAMWHARADERVAEAWADMEPAIFGPLQAAGVDTQAIRDSLPTTFGAYELYDAVTRQAISNGKTEQEARALAQRAYDQWATPSRNAAFKQAVADISGPLPLNRPSKFDRLVSKAIPFSFWNSRITMYLMEELFSSRPRVAAFERYQNWADQYQRDHPEMPSYLRGYLQVTSTPFGIFLAANPATLFMTTAFLQERADQDGVNKSTFDEIRDNLGSALGFSIRPELQFLAQAGGYSKDRQIDVPILMPPEKKAFDAFLNLWSAASGGTGITPLDQQFFTWLSSKVLNPIAVQFLPGAEVTSLRNPDLARQSPVHAMIIAQHPELLTNLETAFNLPDTDPTKQQQIDAADEALQTAFDPGSDIYRQAFLESAKGKLFTQTFNMVAPIRATDVNPVVPNLAALMHQEGEVGKQQRAAMGQVEALASGMPPTAPLGTNSTSPGLQPVGTVDWKSDPRWMNHLTGGPAPDVQWQAEKDTTFFANDMMGGTPEFQAITMAEQRYHAIGTPEERQAYADWYAIAYGAPQRTVDMGSGGVYSPADVLALPEEERKMLADQWVATHATFSGTPLAPLLESYRTKRDQFLLSNPEWAQYDTWRDSVQQMVDGGLYPSVSAWAQQEARTNPNFNRLYEEVQFRLQSGEYDQDRAEGQFKSVGAFLADKGLQKNVTDPAILTPTAGQGAGSGSLTEQQIVAAVTAALGKQNDPAEAIRQDLQAYTRDLAVTNSFLKTLGFTSGGWENASPTMQQMARPVLEQYGIPMPQLSSQSQQYLAWAAQNPGGTIEDFIVWQQEQQIAVLSGQFNPATQPSLVAVP